MKRKTRLLCMGSLATIMAVGIDAEVHRLSISEIALMVDRQEEADGELGRWSFSSGEIAAKLPDMARIVLTDGSDAESSTVTAVFAVKSGAVEIRESIEVEMERVGHGSFGVSPRSVAPLQAWLGPRFTELIRGDLALESVDGLQGPLAFQLASAPAGTLKPGDDGIVKVLDRLQRNLVGLQDPVGRSLGNVGFADMQGKARQLSDFRGRVVLLHVWATWCGPCIAAMPGLEALEEHYRDQGLTVVNLSDESADVIQDWLATNPTDMVHGRVDDFGFLGMSGTHANEDGMLRVRPVYVILDRQGYARAHRVGGGKSQLRIVNGPEGETRSTTTDTRYLWEWVRPHLAVR
ncbi:MAG: TlpA disulfide reductase family protein [Gammaproteobacteria bacterium]|nr:TlpA disulfide reductase family protein [Gammaproteobacteria bacterium]